MKTIKVCISFFLLFYAVVAINFEVPFAASGKGGPCSYNSYRGKAKIIAVEKTERSKAQARVSGGPGYEGYEIRFSFTTDRETGLAKIHEITKKEHLFTLTNSWYPGEKYIQKYGIKEGRVYKGTLRIIKTGPCSPVAVKFDDLDPTDYFETKK